MQQRALRSLVTQRPSRLIDICRSGPPPGSQSTVPRFFSKSSPSSPSSPSAPTSHPGLGLAGTAPAHSAYILLHTHAPPASYPPRSRSPLWRALTLSGRAWGAVANFAWAPGQDVHPAYAGLGEPLLEARDGETKCDGDGEREREREAYVASVFSTAHRGRVVIPDLTLANIDALRDAVVEGRAEASEGKVQDAEKLFLYVCTHGARDCRCGDAGGAVVRALREQVERRGVERDVLVGEVAHVGGHKYAANVLVYPYGDWLGLVQAPDVPPLLDALLAFHSHSHSHSCALPGLPPPVVMPFWRGRMGLDREQQRALVSGLL